MTPIPRSFRTYALISLAIVVGTAVILWSTGHPLICKCGYVKAWHGAARSSENSQHLSDWYTLSHAIHGFLFYALFWWIGRRYRWSSGPRFALSVALESAWELLENSPWAINRYRTQTIALDYFGDSVINSVADIAAMAIGFLLAARLPVWVTALLAVAMEIVAGYCIRDNLTLNIIQFVSPIEAIKQWQESAP